MTEQQKGGMEREEALFLAQKMGLPAHDFRGQIFVSDESGEEAYLFTPRTNKAQWADVLMWAAKEGISLLMGAGTVSARNMPELMIYGQSVYVDMPHDNTDAGIMAATITAICRAAGMGRE